PRRRRGSHSLGRRTASPEQGGDDSYRGTRSGYSGNDRSLLRKLTTVQAGDAFLLGYKGLDDHLWVIVSDPTKDAQRVLLISLTTAAPHKESVCLIQAGEHPWVKHETCVAYDKAKVVSLDQL